MDTNFSKPLFEALHRALQCMKHAMEAGHWDPSPSRDPIPFIEKIEKSLACPTGITNLARVQDLLAVALGAMEKGEWSDVSESDISDIQRLNFVASLADQVVPTPAPSPNHLNLTEHA